MARTTGVLSSPSLEVHDIKPLIQSGGFFLSKYHFSLLREKKLMFRKSSYSICAVTTFL